MYSWKNRETILPSVYMLLAAFALSLLVCILEQTNRTISPELRLTASMVVWTALAIVGTWLIFRSERTNPALILLGVTLCLWTGFCATVGALSLMQAVQQALINFNDNHPTADMVLLWTWLTIVTLWTSIWVVDYVYWKGWPQALVRGFVDTSLSIIAEGRNAYRTPQRIQEGESS